MSISTAGIIKEYGGMLHIGTDDISNPPPVYLNPTRFVGIGTTAGSMVLPNVESNVGVGTTAGTILFNKTTNKFRGFTGSVWVDLH